MHFICVNGPATSFVSLMTRWKMGKTINETRQLFLYTPNVITKWLPLAHLGTICTKIKTKLTSQLQIHLKTHKKWCSRLIKMTTPHSTTIYLDALGKERFLNRKKCRFGHHAPIATKKQLFRSTGKQVENVNETNLWRVNPPTGA